MTKQDFELIAYVLREEKPGANWDTNKFAQWEVIVKTFRDELWARNPRFDTARFEKACGLVSFEDWRLGK